MPKFNVDPEMIAMAEKVTQRCEPFELEMKELKIYDNNTSHTLYLDPVEIDSDKPYASLNFLQANLTKDFNWKSRSEFSAHIGIAFSKKSKEVMDWKAKYSEHWKPVKFKVKAKSKKKKLGLITLKRLPTCM